MEGFVIDYLNVRKNIHVIFLEELPDGQFLELLRDFNIETCLYSQRLKRATVILKSHEKLSASLSHRKLTELVQTTPLRCALAERNKFALFEIGGLFVEGSSGIVIRILDTLANTKINIEYQILSPTRYSFLVRNRYVSRCVAKLTSELSIRDSIVSW